MLRRAFALVEEQGGFPVDQVSPFEAASRIRVPVLVIHGDADIDTPPAHSSRVAAALNGSSRLLLVPGAPHNGSLRPEIWERIDRWIDDVIPPLQRPA